VNESENKKFLFDFFLYFFGLFCLFGPKKEIACARALALVGRSGCIFSVLV